jgi:16S rRNA G966 N2-methylase RsmD
LNKNNYTFTAFDCLNLLNNISNENNLIILDPPYLSSLGMYNMTYNKEKDLQILDYLKQTKNDFIYFNYLHNDNFEYNELKEFIKNYNYMVINDKNCSGQNRKNQFKSTQEVLIYNFN